MISQKLDPVWDMPQFERPWPDRPATLRQLVNWAHHIHRSDPQIYTNLLKWPPAKETAKALWRAYQNALPVERQLELAADFNREMIILKAQMDTPKPSKPTVGKARDRLGEKQRRAEARAAERAQKRQLKEAPAPTAYPVGSLFEGVG